MDIQLLIQAKDKPEKSITIKKDVVIGRSQTCQFRVLSNDVSREHCRIVVGADSVAVRDLGSSNGTVVNGQTIPTQTDFPLNPGDKLEVGPLTVVFDFKSAVVAAKPQPKETIPAAATAESEKKAAAPKVKKPTTPAKPQEPSIPVFAAAPAHEDDSTDGPIWSNFGEDLSGDLTSDLPDFANQYGLAESDVDFQLEPPAPSVVPTAPKSKPNAKSPVATAAVVTPTPHPEPLPVAASDEGESSDEPIFGDFDQSTESEFDFDPNQLSESAESAPVTPAAPPSQATPAASGQPGKLKSLFGMFGKGKKAAAPPAKTAVAADAPPSATTETDATETSAEPESPFDLGAGGGSGDDMTDWLLGGGAASTQDEPVAAVPVPTPAVAPPPKPKAAKKPAPVAADSTAAKKATATPKSAPVAAPNPTVVAAPEPETEQDFEDFFSQLGN